MSTPPSPRPRDSVIESVTVKFDELSLKQAAERKRLTDELRAIRNEDVELISPDEIVQEAMEEMELSITRFNNPNQIVLDPSDPVEAVLIKMVELNRRKRADYASDGDPFSNFRRTAERMAKKYPGFSPLDAVEFNIDQKEERLIALHENGRVPSNESVTDTYFDRAVYSAIAVALSMEES